MNILERMVAAVNSMTWGVKSSRKPNMLERMVAAVTRRCWAVKVAFAGPAGPVPWGLARWGYMAADLWHESYESGEGKSLEELTDNEFWAFTSAYHVESVYGWTVSGCK